jgi:hypothetical protein
VEEIWKDVVGYEGSYQVSNLGRVKSVDRTVTVFRGKDVYPYKIHGRILKPTVQNHGYLGVWLYGNGGVSGRNGRVFGIHRIVAEAFCKKKDGDCEVNHINEDKTDNRACNLEWCTHQENSAYGTRGARIGKANTNGKRSVPVAQYTLDGKLVKMFPSFQEAHRNGFQSGNVWKSIHGIYSHAYGYIWKYA